MTMTSQTEAKAVREDRGKTAFANPALRFIDSIGRTMKCHGAFRKVKDRVGGAGITIARLTDAARVQERARRKRVWRVVAHPSWLLRLAGAKKRGHMGVARAAVRGLRERERCRGAPRVGHVLPQRIAKAPMAERHVADLERSRERSEHVELRDG